MRKFIKHLLVTPLIALVISVLFISSSAQAVTGADWQSGNIIDDAVFYDQFSMTVGQIQQFLNSKVPVCDSWGTQPYAGTTRAAYSQSHGISMPLTCLKDFQENGKSSAQIIWEAAQNYHINPQVLIVLLQKEQGLVTDDWPWPVQYRSATGYGCPDTAACDSLYYGFTNQVTNAARQFQLYASHPNWYNHVPGQNNQVLFNPSASCGASTVFIQNQATASLYNYTPYQPNQAALNNLYGTGDSCSAYGNRNFWRYFNDWFGSTHRMGKWLRQSTANGQVWLVAEGQMPDGSYARKKFRMPNWDVVEAYHLQYDPIVQVSEDYLAQFVDDGTMTTTASSIGPGIDFFQFVDNGRRFDITSGQYCSKNLNGTANPSYTWGFDCFNTNVTKIIPGNELLSSLSYSGTLPQLLTYNGVTYKLQNGQKLPFYDTRTLSDMGYSPSQSVTLAQSVNAQQPLGQLLLSHTALVSFNHGPFLVYDAVTQQYHSAGTYDTFQAWKLYQIAQNTPASSYDTSPPAVSAPDLDVWATDGTHNYIIDSGRKIDVTSFVSSMTGVTWQSTAKDLLANLPTVTPTNNFWDSDTGAVYIIDGATKRLVPNWNNFVGLGLTMSQLLPIHHSNLTHIADGDYKLADGSIYYTAANGVSMVDGTTRYHIPSWDFIDNFRLNPGGMVTGRDSLDTTFASGGNLTSYVRKSNGEIYVVSGGQRFAIGEPVRAAWGLPAISSATLLSDASMNRLPVGGELGKFFVYSDGIYYAQGGQKHHVQSWAAFMALGGGAFPPTIPADVFNMIPLGSPIN